jgi:hypothetical protein
VSLLDDTLEDLDVELDAASEAVAWKLVRWRHDRTPACNLARIARSRDVVEDMGAHAAACGDTPLACALLVRDRPPANITDLLGIILVGTGHLAAIAAKASDAGVIAGVTRRALNGGELDTAVLATTNLAGDPGPATRQVVAETVARGQTGRLTYIAAGREDILADAIETIDPHGLGALWTAVTSRPRIDLALAAYARRVRRGALEHAGTCSDAVFGNLAGIVEQKTISGSEGVRAVTALVNSLDDNSWNSAAVRRLADAVAGKQQPAERTVETWRQTLNSSDDPRFGSKVRCGEQMSARSAPPRTVPGDVRAARAKPHGHCLSTTS